MEPWGTFGGTGPARFWHGKNQNLILRLKYGARRIDGNYPADIMTRNDFERVQATTSYGKCKVTTYIVYVLTERAPVELMLGLANFNVMAAQAHLVDTRYFVF